MKKILIFLSVVILIILISDIEAFAKIKKQKNKQEVIQEVKEVSYPIPSKNYKVQDYKGINYNDSEDKFIMIPVNTIFTVKALNPISSETAKKGDRALFYFGSDFFYKNKLVAPLGSKLIGTVVTVKKDELLINFTKIQTSTGQLIPVYAQIETKDGSGVVKSGNIKENTAVNIENNSKIYTSEAGGMYGIGKLINTENGTVVIPQNSSVNVILNQPITVLSNTPY